MLNPILGVTIGGLSLLENTANPNLISVSVLKPVPKLTDVKLLQ
jgi:hypothetical protein